MSDILETMREYAKFAETKSEREAFEAVIDEITTLRALLAPVDDESRHLTTEEQKVFNSALRRSAKSVTSAQVCEVHAPSAMWADGTHQSKDDEALVAMVVKEFIEATTDMPPRTTYTISERSLSGARAAIAAVRPHIEAEERERCAKIAEAFKGNDSLYCLTDAGREGYVTACREIAAAIRSGK